MLKGILKKIVIFVSAIGIAGFFWCFLKTDKYHVPFPIQFSKEDTPCAIVAIEGQEFLLDVDLGSKFALHLSKDLLDKIENKKECGVGTWRDLKGNKYETPSYIIPKLFWDKLVMKDIIIQQSDNKCCENQVLWSDENLGSDLAYTQNGAIGRPILQKFNFLLDYTRMRIIATNDLKKMKKIGYMLHEMKKLPFTIGLVGINVSIDTKWGTRNFSLDTGSSVNAIRASILDEQEGIITPRGFKGVTSQCKMGGKDLDDLFFYSYDLSPELSDIDGILGTPFLDQHVIYIDFKNKVLYLAKSEDLHL
jgi:hypothetical protein